MSNLITKAMFIHRRCYDLIGDSITLSREIDNPFVKNGYFFRMPNHTEQGPFATAELRDRFLIQEAESQARLEWIAHEQRERDKEAQAEEQPQSGRYCETCQHPVSYHKGDRGCTMPLNAAGHVLSRTEAFDHTCGCHG